MPSGIGDTSAQRALIQEASAAFQADKRILACWLEGSFAAGTADAWSDVDLHIAVVDENWEALLGERLQLVGRVRTVLGFVEAGLAWGARLISANVSGPVRLDLFIEKQSALDTAPRREQPVVLFDNVGVADKVKLNWNAEALIELQLAQLVQAFFFGCAWPVRLIGREEWGTMLMNAVSIVYQFLVPAILIQDDATNFLRPQYHNERHLTSERRHRVDVLIEQIRGSFDDMGTGNLDDARVARVHQELIGAIWRELRRACQKHAVNYPDDAEREMREYYQREMGWEIEA